MTYEQIAHLAEQNRTVIDVIKQSPSPAASSSPQMTGYLFLMIERQQQMIDYLLEMHTPQHAARADETAQPESGAR